jgi:thiol-disulfide isomerase/thioredoxin
MLEVKKFSAAWCGPCRALAPVMNEIKGQFGNVKLLRIIDVYGQVIKTFELSLTREETSVDLGFLPPGIYFIHVLGKTKRIVKI